MEWGAYLYIAWARIGGAGRAGPHYMGEKNQQNWASMGGGGGGRPPPPPMLLPQWETLLTLGRVTGGEGVAYRIREYPVQTQMRILMTLWQQNE